MSNIDKHVIVHEATLITAGSVLSNKKIEVVRKFVEGKGLFIMHYDIINDLWHLSDGEAYSTKTILVANFKNEIVYINKIDKRLNKRP